MITDSFILKITDLKSLFRHRVDGGQDKILFYSVFLLEMNFQIQLFKLNA